jgi:hypothetical protein
MRDMEQKEWHGMRNKTTFSGTNNMKWETKECVQEKT